MDALTILFIAGLGVLAIFLFLYNSKKEKERTEAFARLAGEMDLEFFPEAEPSVLADFSRFQLFGIGRRRRIWNMLRGEIRGADVALFDYRYTTGGGKNSHTYIQSVVCLDSAALDLPGFSLRPESIFHKIGGVFGYQDIDFASHPTFSSKYLLRGEPEEAVRDVFTSDVLRFFEANLGLCCEAKRGMVTLYRESRREKPEGVRAFLDLAFRLHDTLCDRGDA